MNGIQSDRSKEQWIVRSPGGIVWVRRSCRWDAVRWVAKFVEVGTPYVIERVS